MSELPATSNFHSSLHTPREKAQIAHLFGALGWRVRKADWSSYEILCPWADLIIEAESPILMHGPVADVQSNAERILAVLREGEIAFRAEAYDTDGELLREWQSDVV